MGAIDFHTHAFPDDLAPRAIARLQAAADWRAVSGGTVGELLRSMDECGLDVSLICTIATKPKQVDGIFAWCREIRSPRIVPLPSVHPADTSPREWINRFAGEGFPGIKLHPMYQQAAADDEAMMPLYEAAAEAGLFVVVHCGRDAAYPPEDDRASPRRFRRVIDKLPGLKLICTHMGGWRDWDMAEKHLLATEVYLETSFAMAELGPQRAADMIVRHGTDRVLMGSDWPWQSQAQAAGLIRGLPLTDEQKQRILRGNAADLLGLPSANDEFRNMNSET